MYTWPVQLGYATPSTTMALFKRLVPALAPNAFIVPGLLAGLVNGTILHATVLFILQSPSHPVILLVVLAPTTALAVIWGCLAQDQRSLIKGSCAVCAGTVLWSVLSSQYSSTHGCLLLFHHYWLTNLRALMQCCVSGVASFVIMLGVGLVTRTVLCTTQCQPGPPAPARWCWKCRYSLAGLSSDKCPECGTSTAAPHLGHPLRDLFIWLHERRRWTAIAFVLAFVTFEFQIVRSRTLPTLAFARAMSPQGQRIDPQHFVGPGDRPFAFALPTGAAEGWHIAATYPSDDGRMELNLVSITTPATPERPARVTFGNARVAMRLNQAHADQVITHGIPHSAVNAMVEAGRAAGWPDSTRVRGYMNIDPVPHFPDAPTGP